jgi:hypothetical protein
VTTCANSHDRDETCADCEPGRIPPREQPGPPVPRTTGLDHVRRERDRLARTDGYPVVPLEPDDDVTASEETTE